MFESKFSYHIPPPNQKKRPTAKGEIQSYIYKVRTTSKKPYFIKVSEFEHDIFFIKFYPKGLELSPDKYKKRVGGVNELSRLVATCLKLAISLLKKNDDAIFGFFGQWDEVDIKRKEKVSQRFRLYTRAVVSTLSKAPKKKFNYYALEEINTFFVISAHFDFLEKEKLLKTYFTEALGNKGIEELFIPES